jgi:hypothetical protein
MRLKLGLSAELTSKFQDELAKQLGDTIWAANIKDTGERYVFTFRMQGSDWTMELDKECNAGAWYTLHCSTRELHLPIKYIKDLKIFCQQIVRIRQMQIDFTDNKNK